MREHHREAIELLFQSRNVMESLKEVRRFLEMVPLEERIEQTWQLVSAAFGSEHANKWTASERMGMLGFYREFGNLYRALVTIDKEMRPMVEALSTG
jgi:hypothetical protein